MNTETLYRLSLYPPFKCVYDLPISPAEQDEIRAHRNYKHGEAHLIESTTANGHTTYRLLRLVANCKHPFWTGRNCVLARVLSIEAEATR